MGLALNEQILKAHEDYESYCASVKDVSFPEKSRLRCAAFTRMVKAIHAVEDEIIARFQDRELPDDIYALQALEWGLRMEYDHQSSIISAMLDTKDSRGRAFVSYLYIPLISRVREKHDRLVEKSRKAFKDRLRKEMA